MLIADRRLRGPDLGGLRLRRSGNDAPGRVMPRRSDRPFGVWSGPSEFVALGPRGSGDPALRKAIQW